MAANYKQIITELYQRYNPEKVGEVDKLLKQFKGREVEMVYKIYLKYGPPESRPGVEEKLRAHLQERDARTAPASPPAIPVPDTDLPVQTEAPGPAPSARSRTRRILVVVIALALIGGLSYAGWQVIRGEWNLMSLGSTEPAADLPPPQFVLANAVYARNECGNGGERTDAFLRYGEALREYTRLGDCLRAREDSSGIPSYFPAKYFLEEKKFREADAIFGNDAARDQIKHSYEKLALRSWFRHHGFIGKLSPQWRDSIVPPGRDAQVWQIFAENDPGGLNTWVRGQFRQRGPSLAQIPEDLACIIQRPENPDKRKLLYFSFDKDGESEIHEAFDMDRYPNRLLRKYPQDSNEWKRFFHRITDSPFHEGIVLEDRDGNAPAYLLLWNSDHFVVHEEIPRDTIRIPGIPPFIM